MNYFGLSAPDWTLLGFYVVVLVVGGLLAWKWPPRY